MFRILRKMLASILISLVISCSSLFFQSHLYAAHIDIQSPLVEFFQNAADSLHSLDYHTSSGVAFKIPAVDQEIYFDLETPGSGDLFEPLPAIRGQLRTALAQSGNVFGKDTTTADKFAELGKTLVKSELLKRSKDTEFAQWFLENSELSPLKFFVIKEALLLIDSIKKQDLDQLKIETVCLLFRLSLTKDFGILNKDKPLTAQFPNEVREALGAKFCAYIDDTWATVIRGMNNETIKDILDTQKKNAGVTVHSFICRDQALAENVFKHVKSYAGTDFKKYVSKFIKNKDHDIELVETKDFADVSSGNQDDKEEEAFANKLGTFTTVGGISDPAGLATLPQDVREKATNVSQFPCAMSAKTAQGDYWVCYITNNLGLLDTGKLGLAALVKALRHYAGKRQEYVKTHGEEIKKERKAREGDAARAQKVSGFLRTDAGIASAQRIADALKQLEILHQEPVLNAQELSKNLEIANQELDALQTSRVEKQEEIEKLNKHINAIDWSCGGPKGAECYYGQFARKAQLSQVIKDIELKVHDIDAKIIEKQAKIATLKKDIKRTTKASHTSKEKLAELKKDLKELLIIEADQRRNNGTVSSDVSTEITGLRKEIEALGVQDSPAETLEQRIEQRVKQAVIYEQEADVMNKELDGKLEAIKNIKDLNKRRREQCKFTYNKNFYHLYIQDLKNKAATIKNENDLMAELKNWRDELHGKKMSDIAKDDLERISFLEKEVGYLLDNKTYGGFLFKFIDKRPELRDFFADTMNKTNVYHQDVIDLFSMVAQRSGHIKDNALVYRDAVRAFVPDLAPIFDKATGFQDVTYAAAAA